ncbi:parafibromin [Cryptococcus deuterogattii R265]|uniref:parafibromin n=1 Tax=Cryptococcus deuterogattii (strain R265) TaxID=294750 RepID=UPI001937ECC9|nr:parafibromin [Cryptococcus deuterogattii R265]
MASNDPLDLLKSSLQSSNPPELLTAASEPAPSLALAAYLSFTSTANPINLPKDTPTRYTSKPGSTSEFYNIGQLYLAWIERDSGVRDYLIKGQAGGVGYVAITDRRPAVDYLLGKGDGEGRIAAKGEEGAKQQPAGDSAASATAEALPSALVPSTEAGPSKVSAQTKRKYEVDVVDREFCRKLRSEEIELRDRNSVLRSSAGGKANNFEAFQRNVMHEKIKTLRTSFEKGGKQPAAAATSQSDLNRAKKARSTNPIIVISSSPTSLITMWNVKKFLEQGVFEPSETVRQREASQGNIKVEDMIPVIRKRSGPHGDVTSKYYIVDSADALQKFGQDAWDRVVCVVTTGQTWQFKPYKWDDPKVLFQNVKGIYFQWGNDPVNPAVRDWNVTEMKIDRNKRHTDRQVVADFWRILDNAKRR